MPILRILYQLARESFDCLGVSERSKTVLFICFSTILVTIFWRLIALLLVLLTIPYVLEIACRGGLCVKRAVCPRRQSPAATPLTPAKPQVGVCHLPAVRCANAEGQLAQSGSLAGLDVNVLSNQILATATVRGPVAVVDPMTDPLWIGMSEAFGINFHALPVVAGTVVRAFRRVEQLTQKRMFS
ncbi:MAG: hypothetical protein HQ567_24645 [Candidatus Nealsonbacteria bacterium]|nr:hypothetical protein [Candidatus Nealsonbacteria bacterium]